MSAKQVADLYERVKKEPLLIDQFANRYNRPGQPEERTITIGKGEPVYTHEAVESAVHALKEADEVSDLIKTEHGWCAVKLIDIIQAKTDAKFEDEKEALLAEVKREKLEQALESLHDIGVGATIWG
jgi:hypothetical protein